MDGMALAKELVKTLPTDSWTLFNQWVTPCKWDHPLDGPQQRLDRLGRHLSCDPSLIICGESSEYDGTRYSGICYTSERLILEGQIPRIDPPAHRLSTRHLPFSEKKATIIWKSLYEQGLAERTVMWSCLPIHPHGEGRPWSNRAPNDEEVKLGAESIKLLLAAFPKAKLVALGRLAGGVLTAMNAPVFTVLRHPANGGANEFKAGLESVAQELRVEPV